MIRWLFSFIVGLFTDELRHQWRAFLELWDAEIREAERAVGW